MKKARVILRTTAAVIIVALVALRIAYVNKNARLPEVKKVPQGQSAEYKGLEYTVVGAKLWDYEEYFEENKSLSSYYTEYTEPVKLLIVEYRITTMEEDNMFSPYIPIQYANLFNGIDPYMTAEMNPSLADGTFKSGDTVIVPYEIYKENLTDKQWEDVVSLNMEYETVLGTYPVKIEMEVIP